MNRTMILFGSALLLLLSQTLPAQCPAYFRVLSSNEVILSSYDGNGNLSWINATPGSDIQIQSADSLSASSIWEDVVIILATNSSATIKVCDHNPPLNMSYIPEGVFTMGTATNMGHPVEFGAIPQHRANIQGFYMDKFEVTKSLWDQIKQASETNGYSYTYDGYGYDSNHPVLVVNWYDAVKWCNARSEQEGLTPAYYTHSAHSNVYRTGVLDLSNSWVNWSANGYRLPTEAEWEKAARGGAFSKRFPWMQEDTIQHARANYFSTNSVSFDTSPTRGFHPTYNHSPSPSSSPVGSFASNKNKLYDMAGNALEWCWDAFESTYYSVSPLQNPRGPVYRSPEILAGGRVARGGGSQYLATLATCSYRAGYDPAEILLFSPVYVGFRCTRSF